MLVFRSKISALVRGPPFRRCGRTVRKAVQQVGRSSEYIAVLSAAFLAFTSLSPLLVDGHTSNCHGPCLRALCVSGIHLLCFTELVPSVNVHLNVHIYVY